MPGINFTPAVCFFSRYDSYDPLLKAPICSLPGGVRRKCVRDEKVLSDSTSLIAADGTLVLCSLVCEWGRLNLFLDSI